MPVLSTGEIKYMINYKKKYITIFSPEILEWEIFQAILGKFRGKFGLELGPNFGPKSGPKKNPLSYIPFYTCQWLCRYPHDFISLDIQDI